MRRWIYILGILSIMTGCSFNDIVVEDHGTIVGEESDSITIGNEKVMYIDEKMKELIEDINSLGEKYGDLIEDSELHIPYINVYQSKKIDVNFNNEMIASKEYFDELVILLDRNIAKGLKEHIEDMEKRELTNSETILRKVGRAVITTENIEGHEGNEISIRVNFSDLEDEDYRVLLNTVSDNKYILEKLVLGEQLHMMDLVNPNDLYYQTQDSYLNIRYNIFLKDKSIEKVNILTQAKNISELGGDDIEVFTNLLDTLELNEEEKDDLLDDYKNILKSKNNSKRPALEKYNVSINSKKGNSSSGKVGKLIYYSIEKN